MDKLLARWMPLDASEHGQEIDRLIGVVHWLMLFLFLAWGAYFLYVLWRFNERRNPRANYHGTQSHFSTYAEAGIAIVEVVLLVAFSIPAWYRWTQPPGRDKNPLEVRVVGEQFAWNVHYPGADGIFGRRDVNLVTSSNPLGLDLADPHAKDDIVTLNQLHLEQGRDTIIHISSKDVIHSFKIPVMRAEQDAIPGMDVKIHFKPVKANDNGDKWEIACAQLCGLGHYRMRGDIHVHKKADFNKWLVTEPKAQSSLGS